MVKEYPVYLFLGQDASSKSTVLNRLKERLLPKETQEFNLDILYAKELSLAGLQEKLLFLPVNLAQRLVVIKNAQDLKAEIKDFLVKYVKEPQNQIILVIDVERPKAQDDFVQRLNKFAQIYHFKEERRWDVFDLSRQIELRKAGASLLILHQLLQEGEKPERILGGLRASWLRNIVEPVALKKRIKMLLKSDIDLKTSRIKPVFVLERLVISLCGLKDFSG
jgi:DNA polymerase III delta subunit